MTRTAVIGAGPCGLAQLNACEQARLNGIDVGEVVSSRRSPNGRLWN
jgi:trimethylamine monooxygenase